MQSPANCTISVSEVKYDNKISWKDDFDHCDKNFLLEIEELLSELE